jgi:hypothetical protein
MGYDGLFLKNSWVFISESILQAGSSLFPYERGWSSYFIVVRRKEARWRMRNLSMR